MLLLDLQKAFDTVNHAILLSKLRSIGSDTRTVEWFRSYLTGRTQITDINGTISSETIITCGAPQGSILGPLLFNLYINDMQNSVSCKLMLYADDSILLVPGNNVTYISNSLQLQLGLIRDWLSINKLSLHIGKTQSILFGTKRKLNNCEKLNVICDGNLIESKTNVKYLGLIIDETLSGTAIALNIIAKNNQT